MSNIPLKDMNLARSVIDIIREISDACCTGKSSETLETAPWTVSKEFEDRNGSIYVRTEGP